MKIVNLSLHSKVQFQVTVISRVIRAQNDYLGQSEVRLYYSRYGVVEILSITLMASIEPKKPTREISVDFVFYSLRN